MAVIADIISQMHSLSGKFPNQEQKVADFILGNLESAAYMRQTEIAQAAKVSDATVNRFCRSLDCDGFREFKIKLVQSVAVSSQITDEPLDEEASIDQIVNQVFSSNIDSLNLARSQIDEMALGRAANALTSAKKIIFLGVGGSSAILAHEGVNRFSQLGIACQACSDGYMQRMLAATLEPDDVVLFFSASGQPVELLDSAAIAKQYGAFSIAITKTGSELASKCNVALTVDLPENPDIYKPGTFRSVFLTLLDILCAATARNNPEKTKDYLRRISTSLASLNSHFSTKPIGD